MNLLLIDNRVSDPTTVINSLLPGTKYVMVDYELDTLESLQNKITEVTGSQKVTNVGIFQENYNTGTYQYIGQFGQATLTDIETVDPEIATWTDFTGVLTYFKNVLNVTNLDLMGCNINKDLNWKYVIGKLESSTGLVIRSSDDYTGSSELGGNWILESDNVELIGTYFTESIKEYNFVLGGQSDSYASYVLAENGILYACGNNGNGQYGNGTNGGNSALKVLTPVSTIPSGRKCIQYSNGLFHLIVLLDDGTVYGCGRNNTGQLGNGTLDDTSSLIKCVLPTSTSAIQVACSEYTSYVLMNNGTLYSCGNNSYGQLGDGSKTTSSSFLMVQHNTGKKIVSISAGNNFIMCLLDDGSVYGFGNNSGGPFGNGTTSSSYLTFTQLVNNTGKTVKQVSCGGGSTVLLMTDNTVYGCGSNSNNKLSLPNGTDTTILTLIPTTVLSSAIIKRIECSRSNIYLLTTSDIYGCGDNDYGQLGNGTYTDSSTLIKMTAIPSKTPISMYSARDNIIVTMNDGTVYACGYNFSGQLGTNDNLNQNVLTQMKLTSTTYITGVNIKSNINIILIDGTITYNGNNIFSNIDTLGITMYTLDYGLDTYQQITLSSIIGNYNDYNVGTNIPIQISVLLLRNYSSGTTITNYLYPSTQVITGTITKKSLTYTVSNSITKVYDGNNTATTLNFNFNGLVSGEIPNKTYTATYDDINVGVGNRNVTVTSLTLVDNGSFLANNYSYSSSIPPFPGTITTKPLTYTYGYSNIYDGKTSRNLTFNYIGLVNTEIPNTNYTATFNDANFGPRNLSVSNILLVNNPDTGFVTTNYSYTNLLATTIITNIVAKALTIGANVTDKVYDGTNVATNNITLTFSGLVGTETPKYDMRAKYDDANVGTSKAIGFDYITTSTNDLFISSNYTLGPHPTVTGNILAKELIITINSSTPKIYDGTNTATLNTTANISGAITGETPIYSFVSIYNNPDAGTNKTITISSVVLTNNLPFKSTNYYATHTSTLSNAVITPRVLGITITSVTPKTYDGNTNATANLSFTNAVSSESSSVRSTNVANYNNTFAGTSKQVEITSITLLDNGVFKANNYSLGSYPTARGTINKKLLSFTINSSTAKTYDGTVVATNNIALGVDGNIVGEIVKHTFGASYNNADYGEGKTITVDYISLIDDITSGFIGSNYDTGTYPSAAIGVINKKEITASINSVTKVYDGTVGTVGTVGIDNLSFSGIIAGQTPSCNPYTIAFDDADVGTNKGVTANGFNLIQNGAFKPENYVIGTGSLTSMNGTITAKPASATPNTVLDKIYDGSDSATVTLTISGLVADQTPDYTCVATFNTKNAGQGRTVTITGVTYLQTATFKPTNYTFPSIIGPTTLKANITQKTLTYTLESFTKPYDGTNTANPKVAFTGLVGSEKPDVVSDAVYANVNVGTGKTVTLNYFYFNNSQTFNLGNYDYYIDSVTVNTAIITPREITPAITNTSKVYDGTDSTNAVINYTNLVTGETPIFTCDNKYNNANVGSDKIITISNIQFSNNGTFIKSNYSYSATNDFPNCSITTKQLVPSITSVTSKAYDGTTVANSILSFTGTIGSQIPDYTSTSSFDSANVATSIPVTVSNIQLLDNGLFIASNYTAPSGQIGTGTITKKTLTASVVSVESKEYDGTLSATPVLSFVGNVVGEEVGKYTTTASFIRANPGVSIPVTVSNIQLLNNNLFIANNYTVSSGQTGTGTITKKTLTASIESITDKVYDGNLEARAILSFAGVVSGQIASYDCTASFNNAEAGVDKNVVVNTIALRTVVGSSFNRDNYTVTAGQTGTANITAKPLTATITSVDDKVYDGTAAATVLLDVTGVVPGETPTWENTATFDTANVGTDKDVTVNTITSLDNIAFKSSNYTITTGQIGTANITAKELTATITSVDDKVYDGTTAATVLLDVTGVVPGETPTWTSTATFDTPNVGTDKEVTVNTITSPENIPFILSNYTIEVGQKSTANITAKPLTFTVTNLANKVYDGTIAATVSLGVTGFVNGEQPTWTNTATFDTPNAGTNKEVTVNNITPTDNTSFIGSNYSIPAIQKFTANITAKPLTATITSVANKVYDGTTTAVAVLNVTGSITGETPLWTNTAAFNTKTAGSNRLVTVRSISLRNNGAFIGTNYSIAIGQTRLANITKRLLGFKYLVKARKYAKGNKKATMVFSNYKKLAKDIVAISKYTATYNSDAISNSKPVTITKVTLTGRDSANYSVSSKYTTKGNITK
jgi:alpha-tubulin suppressor-like RCC1 family protein